MNFKTKGIVLKQKNYLENQKYLDILTPENGILNVKLRIHGKITRNIFSNIYVCGFYEFNLFCGQFGAIIDDVEEIEQFFNLRFFPEKLALAQYFCELSYILSLPTTKAKDQLNLLLNSIWLLEKEKAGLEFVKAVFELKLLSYSGHMPNLVCCKLCYSYEKEEMFFNIYQSFLVCKDCFKNVKEKNGFLKLSNAVLYAMRFIIYKDKKDIFKFKLEKNHLNLLGKVVEKSILSIIEKEPLTLKIYKEFKEEFKV